MPVYQIRITGAIYVYLDYDMSILMGRHLGRLFPKLFIDLATNLKFDIVMFSQRNLVKHS